MVTTGRRARCALLTLAIAPSVALTACIDPLDQQTSLIRAPRVLAVIPTPAEAAPSAAVEYSAVVATPDGPLDSPALGWAHCTAPKPPTEDNVVSPPCVDDPTWLVPLGSGPTATVTATMPADACRRFGPDTPPGGFRPRDPDLSGGYYQPVRAELTGTATPAPVAFGLHRIGCNLGDAPPTIVRDYRDRYRANQHPVIAAFTAAPTAAPGESVTLTVSWPADAAEPYVSYDRAIVAIIDRRESLRVGWFTTAGALASDATGVATDDPATSTSVTWTAPDTALAAPAHLWAVLHDDRGGVAVSHITIASAP